MKGSLFGNKSVGVASVTNMTYILWEDEFGECKLYGNHGATMGKPWTTIWATMEIRDTSRLFGNPWICLEAGASMEPWGKQYG